MDADTMSQEVEEGEDDGKIEKHVDITGNVLRRWLAIGDSQGLTSLAKVANFLAEQYETTQLQQRCGSECVHCRTPLTLYCLTCQKSAAQQRQVTCAATRQSSAEVKVKSESRNALQTVTYPQNDAQENQTEEAECNKEQQQQQQTDTHISDLPLASVLPASFSSILDTAADGLRYRSSLQETSNSSVRSSASGFVSGSVCGNTAMNRIKTEFSPLQRAFMSDVSVICEDVVKSSTSAEKLCNSVSDLASIKVGLNSGNCQRKSCKDGGIKRGKYQKQSSPTKKASAQCVKGDKDAEDCGIPDGRPVAPARKQRKNRCVRDLMEALTVLRVQSSESSSAERTVVDAPLTKQICVQQKGCVEKEREHSPSPLLIPEDQNVTIQTVQSKPAKRGRKKRSDADVGQGAEENKSVVCDICGKEVLNRKSLYQHRARYHMEKKHKCSQCGEAFFKGWQLRLHSYKHTGERPFSCEICAATFTRKSCLQMHMQNIHQNQKPFVCDKCGQSFKQLAALKTHIRRHTGEKPFQCKLCHLSFAQGGGLRGHMRTHTGAKPYLCKECGAVFSQSGNLQVHLRIHTGERPYVCKECGFGAVNSSQLKRHMWKHTGQKPKPVSCRVCNSVLSSSSKLSRHMKNIHGIQRRPRARQTGLHAHSFPVTSENVNQSEENALQTLLACDNQENKI